MHIIDVWYGLVCPEWRHSDQQFMLYACNILFVILCLPHALLCILTDYLGGLRRNSACSKHYKHADVLQRKMYLEWFITKFRWLTSRSVFSRYFFQKGLIFRCPPMSQTFSFMPWEATLFMLKPWGGPQRSEVTILYIHISAKEPLYICL